MVETNITKHEFDELREKVKQMSKQYSTKEEVDNLKEEVKEIKKEMAESGKLLQDIDKKIDVINEKLITTDKVEELKLMPLVKRIEKLEEGLKWLSRTILGSVISIVIGAIVFAIKQM